MTMIDYGHVSLRDAIALADIIATAQHGSRVGRVVGYRGDDEHVLYGTARSIESVNGTFTRDDEDVRNTFLRVTLDGAGGDVAWNVGDLVREWHDNVFTVVTDAPYVDGAVLAAEEANVARSIAAFGAPNVI